MKTSGSGW
jgi:hypothetical protein